MPSEDVMKKFQELQELYQGREKKTFNAIIYGDVGTGKTNILRTARLPVLVHSFDPGGTITLIDEIEAGKIIVDDRFEKEDPSNPSAFELWEQEFEKLRAINFFEHIGTYAIDSATTWAEAMMNAILKKQGRPGGVPQLRDYLIQMNAIRDAMKVFTSLPCDCVLTGHIVADKDEVTGRMRSGLLITGKMGTRLPLLFDEIYVSIAKQTSKGIEYSLLTRNDGLYQARTRLGRKGRFDTYEKPDIKYLLKKAGFPTKDKPLFVSNPNNPKQKEE